MLTLMIVMIFICGSLGLGGYLIEKSEKNSKKAIDK